MVALVGDTDALTTGDLEIESGDEHCGLVALTRTWTTINVLHAQAELENQIAKGLKLDPATFCYTRRARRARC